MSKKKIEAVELTPHELELADYFLKKFETPQDMRDWILTFIGIDFPLGHIDPDSNSSPVEWMFESYNMLRYSKRDTPPRVMVYSARDCYKTLSVSCFEFIAMIHFGVTAAHMAAIKSQSAKAVSYVNGYLRKCRKYILHHGRKIDSLSQSYISITENEGDEAYLKVIICTLQGANSEHCRLFCVDEVDVVQYPTAFEESKAIPGPQNGKNPLTIMTSTRKFAFGLMQKEIEVSIKSEYPIYHWNIIDVTQRCEDDRHYPEKPKEMRYINRRLPVRQVSEKEWEEMPVERQNEYEKIEAFAGCATCPILPVCKTRLATRPIDDVGGLYKPINHVISQFKTFNPDMAEAQLMCWKPGSVGLIYSRFDDHDNILTLEKAWESFTGEEAPPTLTLADLIDQLHRHEIPFYIGGDWGFRHNYALIASAVMPTGDWWLFETFAMSGLEFEDQLKYAKEFRDKYRPKRWFMDPAYPGNLKTFTKNGMPCKEFKKDILYGIESVRGQVVMANGRRRLKVLKTPDLSNDILIQGFKMHHFMTDAQGRVTPKPDDEEFADVMDSLRYLGQNLFPPKKKAEDGDAVANMAIKEQELQIQKYLVNQQIPPQQSIYNQIVAAQGAIAGPEKGWSKNKRVFFDFGAPE